MQPLKGTIPHRESVKLSSLYSGHFLNFIFYINLLIFLFVFNFGGVGSSLLHAGFL